MMKKMENYYIPFYYAKFLFVILLYPSVLISTVVAQEHNFVEVIFDATCLTGLDGTSNVTVSPDGAHIYVTGRIDNAINVFTRNQNDGSLNFNSTYKDGIDGIEGLDGANGVVVSPDGDNVYVAGFDDDAIVIFNRDASDGTLSFNSFLKDGVDGVDGLNGARRMALSPNGAHVYVTGVNDDALAVFNRNETNGSLSFNSVLMDGVGGIVDMEGAASVAVSPDGIYVYLVAAFDDAILVFDRNTINGSLSLSSVLQDGINGVDGLDGANSVALSPDGGHIYVAGRNDEGISVFSRMFDGNLSFIEVAGVDSLFGLSSVVVSPDGSYVYAALDSEDAVAIFNRNETTGHLSFNSFVKDGEGGVNGLDGAIGVCVSSDNTNVYATGHIDDAIVTLSRQQPVLSLSMSDGIRDHSGGKYHGYSPTPLETANGPCGQGLVIGKNTSEVIFLPGQSVDGLGDFTISFDVALDGLNNSNNIISFANSHNANELIIGYNDLRADPGLLLTIDGAEHTFSDTEGLLADMAWHNITITRSNDQATLYFDGTKSGNSITVSDGIVEVDPGGFVIGQDQDIVGGGFQTSQSLWGAISRLEIYQYALDAVDINSLICSGCPAAGIDCDDGNPNTTNDQEDGACNCIGTPIDKALVSMHFDGTLSDASQFDYQGCGSAVQQYPSSNCDYSISIGANTDDYVFLPGQVMDGLGDFTISVNARILAMNNANNLLSCANYEQSNELLIGYLENEGISVIINGVKYVFSGTEAVLNDLNYHHIVITREGHTARLYLDGSLIRTRSISNKILKVVSNGFVIGQDQDNVGGGFDANQSWAGEVDLLRVFAYTFKEEAISLLDCTECPLTAVLNSTPLTTTCNYAEKRIYSRGNVDVSSEDVLFQAGEFIELDVNFQVDKGAIFRAQIDDCPLTTIQLQLYAGATPSELLAAGAHINDFIGLNYGGGIIFYIEEDGSGLVAAPLDLGFGSAWGCVGTFIQGADGTIIGTGYQNTIDVITGCSEPVIAAELCFIFEKDGYEDWYLPSIDELMEMYFTIGYGATGINHNVGSFNTSDYWSSSEKDQNQAYEFQFGFGLKSDDIKSNDNNRVRAIRAFD